MNEGKALRELQAGSEEALAWFITQYSAYVSTIIYNIIGTYMPVSDVEETASDVFVAFWNNAQKVKPGSVRGYLGAVARNMAKNRLRKQGFELPLDEQILITDGVSPETVYQKKELNAAVKRAVLAMKQPEKEIFLRFYYYSQPIEAIASEMGLNTSTVKTKLRRGRGMLKQTLEIYLI